MSGFGGVGFANLALSSYAGPAAALGQAVVSAASPSGALLPTGSMYLPQGYSTGSPQCHDFTGENGLHVPSRTLYDAFTMPLRCSYKMLIKKILALGLDFLLGLEFPGFLFSRT